jgi:hypothetical protein
MSQKVIPFLKMNHEGNKPDAARQSIGGDVNGENYYHDNEDENDSDE